MAGLASQSDLGADDLPGVEQAEQADSEPRTPPPRKRRGRGQRKSGKKPPQPKKTDTMKCKSCNKVKQSSEFYADQLSCKLCNSGKRALLRTADAQGCREAVQKFQSQNPDGFEAMQRAFNKERAEQAKTQGKIKFSCDHPLYPQTPPGGDLAHASHPLSLKLPGSGGASRSLHRCRIVELRLILGLDP